MSVVCSYRFVKTFDNFLRPFVHDCRKLFGSYVREGDNVADIGCGAGFATIGLAHLVGSDGKVTAVDLQEEMLDIVRKRVYGTPIESRVVFHRCRENSIDLNEAFQFINAFWMVHEVPDPCLFCAEIKNCLTEGGLFFVAEPRFHVSRKRFRAMIAAAESNGLKLLKQPSVLFSMAALFVHDSSSG